MVTNTESANNLDLVIDYLKSNPDIFLENPALLSKLNLPHLNERNVSSLIEYQVENLRKNERQLKAEIGKLKLNKRQSENLANQAYEQALEIMHTETIEALYDKLFLFLKQEYLCSHFCIFFFVEKRPYRDYRDLRFKQIHSNIRYLFSGLYNVNKPLCDSLPSEYLDDLFGNDSTLIKSTVSLPIKEHNRLGLFILGSQIYDAYQQGFSIHLLNYLKDVFVFRINTLLQ